MVSSVCCASFTKCGCLSHVSQICMFISTSSCLVLSIVYVCPNMMYFGKSWCLTFLTFSLFFSKGVTHVECRYDVSYTSIIPLARCHGLWARDQDRGIADRWALLWLPVIRGQSKCLQHCHRPTARRRRSGRLCYIQVYTISWMSLSSNISFG